MNQITIHCPTCGKPIVVPVVVKSVTRYSVTHLELDLCQASVPHGCPQDAVRGSK